MTKLRAFLSFLLMFITLILMKFILVSYLYPVSFKLFTLADNPFSVLATKTLSSANFTLFTNFPPTSPQLSLLLQYFLITIFLAYLLICETLLPINNNLALLLFLYLQVLLVRYLFLHALFVACISSLLAFCLASQYPVVVVFVTVLPS